MNENNTGILEMPPLKTHKYLEIVKNDEYLSDEYNVLKNKNKEVRDAFTELIRNDKNYITLHINDDNYCLVSYKIQDLCWYIIRLIKESYGMRRIQILSLFVVVLLIAACAYLLF